MANGKRISSACKQCRQRKRRCDGATPRCNHCAKHERECIYLSLRRRGPGKSKAINLPDPYTQQRLHPSSSESEPDRPPVIHYGREDENWNTYGANQSSREHQTTTSQGDVHHSSEDPSNLEENLRVLPAAAEEFMVFSADVRRAVGELKAQMDPNGFARESLTKLPPKHLVVDILQQTVEEVQLHGLFLTKKHVLSLIDKQYVAGSDNHHSDPCRWAIICSFLGISVLHRTTDESLAAMSPIAWAYFKSSFATFAELAIREPKISSCEALLAMALFMLRTANTRVAAQLIATVTCMVLMLGLHKQDNYVHLDADVSERYRRVFWVVFIMNAEMAHSFDIPSPFGEEAVVVDVPEDGNDLPVDNRTQSSRSTGLQQVGLLRHRAALAIMQFRIFRLLRKVNGRLETTDRRLDLLEAITKALVELEVWKDALPTHVLSDFRAQKTPRLDMPVAMLQYIYLSCISKLSMAATVVRTPASSDQVLLEGLPPIVNDYFPNNRESRARCATAARRTLEVLLQLRPQPFINFWQTLCFALSAVLILLSDVLSFPDYAQAEIDAKLIYEFTEFLERLENRKCDVKKIINGCRRLWCIANCALIASKTRKNVIIFGQTVNSIQERFAKVVDWFQIAHGLLSNTPLLRGKTREVLAGIFRPSTPEDSYGDLVPSSLKSQDFAILIST